MYHFFFFILPFNSVLIVVERKYFSKNGKKQEITETASWMLFFQRRKAKNKCKIKRRKRINDTIMTLNSMTTTSEHEYSLIILYAFAFFLFLLAYIQFNHVCINDCHRLQIYSDKILYLCTSRNLHVPSIRHQFELITCNMLHSYSAN